MLIAQDENLQLLPDTPEAVWGLVSLLMIVVLVAAVVGLLVWVKRSADRRGALEARVESLEAHAFEDRSA
jgi:uncharacterized iron-regulated membrane protein